MPVFAVQNARIVEHLKMLKSRSMGRKVRARLFEIVLTLAMRLAPVALPRLCERRLADSNDIALIPGHLQSTKNSTFRDVLRTVLAHGASEEELCPPIVWGIWRPLLRTVCVHHRRGGVPSVVVDHSKRIVSIHTDGRIGIIQSIERCSLDLFPSPLSDCIK